MPSNIWTHHNPVKITSGPGALSQLHNLVPEHGALLLLTTPGFSRRGAVAQICEQLGRERVHVHDRISPNPDLDDLDQVVREYRRFEFSCVVGLGGGSVLDTAKVLGTTLALDMESPLDSLLRHKQNQAPYAPIPITAIPATSGTGAEVTPFATVWDGKNQKKHSLAGEHVYPKQALLDPELTLSLPYQQTLYTGLDAISHALESLWNKNRTPISAAEALQALRLGNQALPVALKEPQNLEARTMMQEASLLAGLAISQSKTAIAHSISYPITIHYQVPHGLACSFTLPGLIKLYAASLREGEEKDILIQTQETLSKVGLHTEICRYIQSKTMQEYTRKMFQTTRANNFVLQLGEEDIKNLLDKSLSDCF